MKLLFTIQFNYKDKPNLCQTDRKKKRRINYSNTIIGFLIKAKSSLFYI